MSDYCRMKVVRYKLTEQDLIHFGVKDGYELRDMFEKFLDYDADRSKYFIHSYASGSNYLDFILINEEGYGDYGKVRKLSETETNKYHGILGKQFAEMNKARDVDVMWLPDPRNFRLVDFCWYDGVDAPDYFDETDDPFYMEV